MPMALLFQMTPIESRLHQQHIKGSYMLNAAGHSMESKCECETGMVSSMLNDEEITVPQWIWTRVEARAYREKITVEELIVKAVRAKTNALLVEAEAVAH